MTEVVLDPGNAADDDSYRPRISLEHDGNELYVIVGEVASGTAEGVDDASWAAICERQSGPSLDAIRRACFDPGAFVERERTLNEYTDDWDYEPLHAWQARAVAAALGGEA